MFVERKEVQILLENIGGLMQTPEHESLQALQIFVDHRGMFLLPQLF